MPAANSPDMPSAPTVVNGITVDPVIFTQGFVDRCDISRCGGECCNSGVWADVRERDRILEHRDMVIRHMDETQSTDPATWFDAESVEDHDFDSGRAIGTQVVNDRCVFQMNNGFCVLQTAAMNEGMHPWAIKPKYCVMFPIVITDNTLGYDDDHSADMHYCGIHCHSNHTHTIFEACGAEIAYAVGDAAYAELKAHYDANRDTYRAAMERGKLISDC